MGVFSRPNMKCLALLFVVAASSAKSYKEGGKQDGGLYFDDGEVMLACTAGTAMGARLSSAMDSCMNETGVEGVEIVGEMAAAGRKKKTCRGRRCQKNKKCPTAEMIMQTIKKGRKVNFCILQKLGWMDSDMKAVMDVMKEDMMSLPTEVSDKISKEKMTECADKIMDKMSNRYKNKKCSKKFSDADREKLANLGLKTAQNKCFQKQFTKSCQTFVRKEIYEFYEAKMTATSS